MNSNSDLQQLVRRGVQEIISEDALLKLLKSGKKLRFKCGFDPSYPDIHLGHMVVLRKLRQFQDMGHQVVLLVGDWTAQIGDPSGKSQTRPMLTAQQVKENAVTYMEQFFKIADKDKTEVRWQSEWLGNFNLSNIFELTSKFTVAQMLAREDFNKRFTEQQPITITELIYPMLQGYDSVMLKSDVECGGTDQKFNLLVGRDLQEVYEQSPQQVLLVPLLVGTDGTKKMSKSLHNYIGVSEAPEQIYGKVMSIRDDIIFTYFELLTDLPMCQIADMQEQVKKGANPMQFKKLLAQEIIKQLYSHKEAEKAADFFMHTVQNKEIPDDIPEYTVDFSKIIELKNLLFESGLADSKNAAARLIEQGSVSVNGQKINDAQGLKDQDILKVGKRRFLRLIK
ncbi:MAG: tyrosine--tRNA ligase [Chloroflexi bacterium]|nr:tyrosine--tRNA ligase [Chloroflexota bacterium]